MTFVSGLLLGIKWQATFLYFLVAIPFLILFMLGYTSNMEKETTAEKKSNANTASKKKKHAKIPGLIYVAFVMLFLYFAAFMVEATASALVIQQNNLANQGALSAEIAVAGLIGAVISMGDSRIFKVLKHFTPVVAIACSAVGFIICSQAANMTIFFVGLLFMMISSLIIPYVYDTIWGDVDSSISNLIISIAQVCNNLGAFASLYVISALSKVLGFSSAVDQMRISACILGVIAIVFALIAIVRSKKMLRLHNLKKGTCYETNN